ncbi:hypothetical protein CK203_022103 [Vitis vinifera]|uniref:Uncharacterized protein n=1 Tax=Vitis vinifera TaxID=29760 RepID=A0A438F7Y6_VITVI|nr:hypothetical protein CK203_093337 [Vitis vinifera]RVW65452.1 hypothetical protein CK203_022103 [Vitis vinifera]
MATLSVTEDCEQLRKAFAVYVVDYFGSSDLFMIVIPFFPNDEYLLLKLLDFEYFLGGCTDRT